MNAEAIAAAKAVKDEADRICEASTLTFEAADAVVAAAQTALVDAHKNFDAAPGAEAAAKLSEVVFALKVAQTRKASAQQALENATRSALTAHQGEIGLRQQAVEREKADGDTAKAERARLAKIHAPTSIALKTAASAEVFHANAAPHAKRAFSALMELRASLAAIDDHFAAAREAGAMHTAASGEGTQPLDAGHALLDLVELLAAEGIIFDEHAWTAMRYGCEPSRGKNGRPIGPHFGVVIALLCSVLEKGPASQEKVERAKARISWTRQTRTCNEARALEAEHEAR